MPEQLNTTNIPSNRVEFIDSRTGLVSREWYRFFLNLFNLAGAGGNQISLDEMQIGPPPMESTGSGGGGTGTVTSVDVSGGTTGLTTSGGPVTSSGTITLGGVLDITNGGTGATTAGSARSALGATTVGGNMFTLTDPSAITFPRFNADNTVTALDAASFRTAIGAGTGGGSVTSVDTAGTVNGLTLTGGPITSSGTITLGGTLDLSSPPTIGNTTPNTGKFTTLTATSTSQFGTGSANYQQMVGAATTLAPVLSVAGSDTNVALAIKTQGTGAIDLAAGSRGVNISNGGTVTAITITAQGSNYTSIPTTAITAPTTAGGVQATFSVGMYISTWSVTSGGTGYTVGDLITAASGGTYSTPWTLLVTAVSGGVITAVSTGTGSNAGTYTVLPSGAQSVTGGTGSGATITINTWGVRAGTATITNAGSGYVEQPTVTFSGGGGSGAAAYATVGSATTVKGLGSQINFVTPGGTAFSVLDTSRTTVDFWQAVGSTGTVGLTVAGATANNNGIITSKGTGFVSLSTNSFNQEQLRVSHTASAVNYVQVTGAATGNSAGPLITAQGSDASIPLSFQSKLNSPINFFTSGGYQQFKVNNLVNAVNYLQVTGSVASASPVLASAGSDTNIDLTLTPKGTGVLKTVAVANIGAGTVLAGATNPLVAMTGNTNQYVQSYIVNNNAGTSASSDFVAYANNSTDSHGWADMGFTSSVYADATYTVTGANEAYLFGSALNSTYTGNLVYATDSTGSANSHQWYVGGFTQAKSAWRMQLTSTLLQAKGTLQLMGSSSGYVGLKGAAAAGSTTYTLPAADGTASQVLSTNGSGTLSWATSASSNITAKGLWENSATISADYSITSGNNALSSGPVTIATGIVVTVPSGSVWTIV
jgi:hypothetical protein